MTVKVINNSVRPDGIILTLLVFGVYSQLTKIVRKVQVTWLAELGLPNSFILHFAC
jgi:hypothetical protein